MNTTLPIKRNDAQALHGALEAVVTSPQTDALVREVLRPLLVKMYNAYLQQQQGRVKITRAQALALGKAAPYLQAELVRTHEASSDLFDSITDLHRYSL